VGLAIRDNHYHTYGEYLTWPEEVRYELIDGVAYLMAPAPTDRHQSLLGELYLQIGNALRDNPCRVRLAPYDVRLPKGDEADEDIDTVVQPDLSVICDKGKIDQRGARGAPDWIIEILSPSTASHDQVRKLRLYERAGVLEYWLLHPIDQVVTIYRMQEGRYGRADVLEMAGNSSPGLFPEIRIDWDQAVRAME